MTSHSPEAGRALLTAADFSFFARELRALATDHPHLVPIDWLREALRDLLDAIETIETAQSGQVRFVREPRP